MQRQVLSIWKDCHVTGNNTVFKKKHPLKWGKPEKLQLVDGLGVRAEPSKWWKDVFLVAHH